MEAILEHLGEFDDLMRGWISTAEVNRSGGTNL